MPKLGSITPRKLVQQLRKAGFVEDHQTGSHLIMYHPHTKRRVVIPIHARDLPKGTLRSILREAGIDPKKL